MPTLPKRKPKQQKQKELALTSRIDKIVKNRAEQGMAYEYDQQDKRELVFNDLKKRYADSLKLSYQWVLRVKHEAQKKEYLVYHCNETVTDRDNNDHHYDSLQGVWQAIEASGKIDPETGERENARVKRTYNVFDIEYSPQAARDLIYDSHLVLQPSQFLVGIASEDISDIVSGRKWVVPNAEEFISADFDVLLYGAQEGWLMKEEGGALEAKDKMLEKQQQHQQGQGQGMASKRK